MTCSLQKKGDGSTADDRYRHQYEIIQFEPPELDGLLVNLMLVNQSEFGYSVLNVRSTAHIICCFSCLQGNASRFEKDERCIFSNIPEIENNPVIF